MKAEARSISAPHSTFVKRVLPFVALAAASAGSYWASRGEQYALELTAFWFVAGSIVMWIILRRGFWRMADTVEDHGDRLVIKRWRTKVEVPITTVREIKRERTSSGGSAVTVALAAPCALGSEIRFLAPGRRKVRDIEEQLDSLSRRVAARR